MTHSQSKLLQIREIIPANKVNMDGHLLDQPLPIQGLDQVDPILLIHHWKNDIPAGVHPRELGVGPHPHRGFSPVTFIYQGELHHRDSRGNSEIVGAGGTQWMSAGFGINHSERPSANMAQNGGTFEIIQCWINTPSHSKMHPPKYHPLTAKETPTYNSEDGLFSCQIVSGEQFNMKGPISNPTPFMCLRIRFKKRGKTTIDIPDGYNTLIYNLDGPLMINHEQRCFMKDMVVFAKSGENSGDEQNHIHLEATDDCQVLLLSGEPIGEPISKYGPFVMNTETEIMEALRDSKMGKMGVLIEEF